MLAVPYAVAVGHVQLGQLVLHVSLGFSAMLHVADLVLAVLLA